MAEFREILVPLDFSEASIRALRAAVGQARHCAGAITLLHVGVAPHVYATDLGIAGPLGPVFTELNDQAAGEQRRRLEQLASEEIPAAIARRLVLREGYPPEEILAQVEEGGHDLVVMGTHGRTGLKRVLLGSVAERVMRDCPVPVLVTR